MYEVWYVEGRDGGAFDGDPECEVDIIGLLPREPDRRARLAAAIWTATTLRPDEVTRLTKTEAKKLFPDLTAAAHIEG